MQVICSDALMGLSWKNLWCNGCTGRRNFHAPMLHSAGCRACYSVCYTMELGCRMQQPTKLGVDFFPMELHSDLEVRRQRWNSKLMEPSGFFSSVESGAGCSLLPTSAKSWITFQPTPCLRTYICLPIHSEFWAERLRSKLLYFRLLYPSLI